MEMQIGHMIQKLDDVVVNTEVNPRKECQAIITGSDKTLDEKKIERKEKEGLNEKDKDVVEKEREVVEREERKKICVKIEKVSRKRKEKKRVREKKKRMRGKKKESYENPRPHSKKYHRKEKDFERFMEIFKKLDIKVPMMETLQQVPGMASSSGKRFKTIIVWREEQAQASRAGVVQAPAMEEEDEDANFEDAEEGEERDSDDSMS
ncbi:hypothetical protein LR48_Vigan11g056200 [Vigna angularis]|uniref:Uncharacterized protein n=1 Tax=Phaseolus angularis TaxID=3914 RepID=A0A0L9VS14_PHAAN|nr:hypothetical protein LR48_Vigan11g056200 [Vigna angularis]